jgi:hypothetical protein
MKRLALWVAWTAVAVVVGFGLALVVLLAVNAALPPFRPEDDETMREFVPAVLTYGTWMIVSVIGSFAAWRRVRAKSA